MTAAEVLQEMRARGGRFVIEGGRLRPRAPAGVDIEDLKAAARAVRVELAELVTGWRCSECGEAKTVMFAMAPPTKDGQEIFVCGACWIRGDG